MASIAAVIDSDVAIPINGADCCPLLVMTRFKNTSWLWYAHNPGDVKNYFSSVKALNIESRKLLCHTMRSLNIKQKKARARLGSRPKI